MEEKQEHYVEQVVDMESLMTVTAEGWSVVERVEFDAPIPFNDSAPPSEAVCQQHCKNGSYGSPSPVFLGRSAIGRIVAFRVRKSGSTVIAQLNEQVAALSQQLRESADGKRKAEEALGFEQVNHQNTKIDLRSSRESTDRVRGELADVMKLRRRLEEDLGKVREAIGRRAFEEIVPPAPLKSEGGA